MIPGRIPGRERWEIEDKLTLSDASGRSGELKIYGGTAGEKVIEIFYGGYSIFSILATGSTVMLLGGSVKPIQFGDAGLTSHGLNTNDDVFVSGRLEIDGSVFFDGIPYFYYGCIEQGGSGTYLRQRQQAEIITIASGTSSGVSAANLVTNKSITRAVLARVTQAPGGGPTNFDVGRTAGGNLDEFIDNQVVALNGTFNIAQHGDDTHKGPYFNADADTITVTVTDGAGTPVNVAGADMKVKVVIFRTDMSEPTS